MIMKAKLGTPLNPRVCNVDILMQDNPRWSEAMGCLPNEIVDRRKQFPNSVYDKYGRLLILNRAHKLKEMKRRNMIER